MTDYRFRVPIASTQPNADGEQFSADALAQMAEQIKGMPLHVNFDPNLVVGQIAFGEIVGGELHIEGHIANYFRARGGPVYAVPALEYHRTPNADGTYTIDQARIIGMSLTHQPADTHLTPIEVSHAPH